MSNGKPIDAVFESPEQVAQFIAEAPADLRDPLWALYAAGIIHSNLGLVVAIDAEEDPLNAIKESIHVH